MRTDKRADCEMRKVTLTPDFTKYAGGSVLCEFGETKVLCTAMIEEGAPAFLKGTGRGWLTAEYAMLPSSTQNRKRRENAKNGADSRSVEISRLIGRSLRCAFDLTKLGERTVYVDCDVLQADGGTRTASITGGYTAAVIALDRLLGKSGDRSYLVGPVAAVSAGYVGGTALLDLCYSEDSNAEADVNIVMLMDSIAEIQGTGEKRAISRAELNKLMDMAQSGIKELYALQRAARVAALGGAK